MLNSIFPNFVRILVLGLTVLFVGPTFAQERTQPSDQADEVLRVTSNLIQTDVMVFDRKGQFVDGLKPDQFELRVDGKPQALSFFERVMAGSSDEDAQMFAARGGSRSRSLPLEAVARPLDRGRVIFFYLDDMHLAPASVKRTRDTLTQYVENELGQNDQAAVVTASGQLGILQQLTGEKIVLLTALRRLKPRPYNVSDGDSTPMTEPQALAIVRNDRAVIDYFMEQISKEQAIPLQRSGRGSQRMRATTSTDNQFEQAVIARAKAIIEQANAVTRATLSGLENLLRNAAPLPGRKVLLFISDGFHINEQSSTPQELLRIADAAARSGTVIYSIEARGLDSDVISTSDKMAFDPTARLASVDAGAATATQDPLYSLATETGGRALLNSNAPARALTQILNETSLYYLLAWRPESTEKGGRFHHIEARVKGRDDLTVRVREGYLAEPPEPVASLKPGSSGKSTKAKPDESPLFAAVRALYPKRALPTALSLGYTNAADLGSILTASVHVDRSVLGDNTGGAQKTEVDVLGILINDQGKTVADFQQRLTIDPSKLTPAEQLRIVYSAQVRIPPGLYQVRVASRDNKSARTGSAIQWIEIPDITRGGFSLGSLFVGEMLADSGSATPAARLALINVNRRFSRTSRLVFQTYVYNAARTANAPDIALQVQIFRDNQPVVTIPLRRLSTAGTTDLARIPYDEELALNELPAGRYVLQVGAIDRVAKVSAAQRINFEIE